jgi:hypothetical protein
LLYSCTRVRIREVGERKGQEVQAGGAPGDGTPFAKGYTGKFWPEVVWMRRWLKRLFRDERGQMSAEYGLLTWVFVFFGSASLVWFLMAMEEAAIDHYQDIVSVVCLPVP